MTICAGKAGGHTRKKAFYAAYKQQGKLLDLPVCFGNWPP
jgi:hypothetical protein